MLENSWVLYAVTPNVPHNLPRACIAKYEKLSPCDVNVCTVSTRAPGHIAELRGMEERCRRQLGGLNVSIPVLVCLSAGV